MLIPLLEGACTDLYGYDLMEGVLSTVISVSVLFSRATEREINAQETVQIQMELIVLVESAGPKK